MAFKMKKFSGFGNSPMKVDGKLLKKKKDLKTNKDITPKPKKNDEGFDLLPGFPNLPLERERLHDKGFEMPIPKFVTEGKGGKNNKSKTDSAIEKYFKN
tara:strand:- start:163 stop:459 length:297 start_codon:yes stop_codon:yes gene_type:complete